MLLGLKVSAESGSLSKRPVNIKLQQQIRESLMQENLVETLAN